MPIGNSSLNRDHQLLVPQIREHIEKSGALEPVAAERCDGPAVRYRFRAAPGEIGFISSISNHFCSTCNRLRLTASGRLRPCLLADREIDLHNMLRSGCPDTDIRDALFKAISLKGAYHQVHAGEEHATCRQMSSIGG
jgi:cyclic pyranopterin phosphate synthase